MEAKKSKKGTIIALAVLAAVLIGCLALYFAMKPAPQAGGKSIVVEVIHGDGTSREFKLSTEAEYLGGALVEGKVVEDDQGDYGLYILTADGETADEGKQEWWCVTKGGETVMLGADQQPIADGEHYELTFTVGYDFDV